MVLGGIWHGAAWSYGVWGLCHGLLLGIERFGADIFPPIKVNWFINAIKVLLVFIVISLLWLLFKLQFAEVIVYFKTIALNTRVRVNISGMIMILVYSLPVIIYHMVYLFKSNEKFAIWLDRYSYIGYGLLITMIVLNSGPGGSFIYFQF